MAHPKHFARFCFVTLGLTSLALVALAGCGGGTSSTSSASPVRGGALTVGLNAELNTLDPLKSTALVEREVMLNIYDTLVRVDEKNTVQPDLATSWTYSDPKTLVFTLRSDVKFQDATPFNPDAVVFNINRYLTATGSVRKSDLASVQSVKAVDPTHVQFNLKQPFSPLLATLTDRAGMMLSPTALQATGADPTNSPTNMGSGPFQFKEWTKNDHLSIVRNPTYWRKDSSGGALPYLNGVTYKAIASATVAFQNLQAGAIQVEQSISPQDVATAKTNTSLIYKQIAGLGFVGFMLNTKKAPLDDLHVRRAIAYAINPDEIIHSVLLDNAIKSNGPIPPSSWAYDASIAPFTHDVNQAKAELAQASTQSPTFELKIASGDQTTVTEAQFIQSELKEAGITVNIKPEVFGTILNETAAFNFQGALIGWSGRVDPDGNMYSWFYTGQSNNNMQYSNATVDQLLDGARIQSDQTKRAKDYQDAEKQIVGDASYIFINHPLATQITSAKVHNFILAPTTIIDCSVIYLA
jgi:peptide/nickel transport system substrate-binding protein